MPPLHWFKSIRSNIPTSIPEEESNNDLCSKPQQSSSHTHNSTSGESPSSDRRSGAATSSSSSNTSFNMKELWKKAILEKLPSRKFPNKGLVRDSIAILEEEVQVMTQYAPFIEATPADPSIAVLDRSEVVLGNLIGEGQFSQVFEVCGFDLKIKQELAAKQFSSKNKNNNKKPATQNLHAAAAAADHDKSGSLSTTSNPETRKSWTQQELEARQALIERQLEGHPKIVSCKTNKMKRLKKVSTAGSYLGGDVLKFGVSNHSENSFFASSYRKNSRLSPKSDPNNNKNNNDDNDDDNDNDNKSTGDQPRVRFGSSTPHNQTATKSSDNNNNNSQVHHLFAMKHLKRSLIQGTGSTNKDETQQAFQFAAADLVVEALYLSRLNHPNILKVRGMSWSGTHAFGNGKFDSYFLLLDRLTETMDDRIQRWNRDYGRIPPEHLLQAKTEYARQLAQALLYLHQRRIIFRDLKPLNTGFREEDDQIQLFDFGLCRELPPVHDPPPQQTMLHVDNSTLYFMTSAGTLRYMAVEVLQGKKYNLKADVYSWAMVYYELLAQSAPFSNFTDEDHKTLVCERHHRPSHFFGCVVPASIQSLLADAWQENVEKRYTMAQVCERLQEILEALPKSNSPYYASGVAAATTTAGIVDHEANANSDPMPTFHVRANSTPAVILEATNETDHVRGNEGGSGSNCLEPDSATQPPPTEP